MHDRYLFRYKSCDEYFALQIMSFFTPGVESEYLYSIANQFGYKFGITHSPNSDIILINLIKLQAQNFFRR